jgi:hypothetical protein
LFRGNNAYPDKQYKVIMLALEDFQLTGYRNLTDTDIILIPLGTERWTAQTIMRQVQFNKAPAILGKVHIFAPVVSYFKSLVIQSLPLHSRAMKSWTLCTASVLSNFVACWMAPWCAICGWRVVALRFQPAIIYLLVLQMETLHLFIGSIAAPTPTSLADRDGLRPSLGNIRRTYIRVGWSILSYLLSFPSQDSVVECGGAERSCSSY